MVENTMDVAGWLRKQLEQASPDLLRAMVQDFAEALMGAEADALCGAAYGERSPERVNTRNGYRERRWDTRAGTIELAIPKLREGSYFPDWLLEPRRRAEQALVSVVADATWPASPRGGSRSSCRRSGSSGCSKSQVSRMAKQLDEMVEAFRTRPLEGAPYPYLRLDALAVKFREGGRIVNVCVVHAVAVNARGLPRVLGLDVVTSRGRRRLARLPARPRRPRPGRRPAGDLRRPPRPRRRDRRDAARRGLAALPDPLHAQPADAASPRARSAWSRRWCARSSPSPTPTRCTRSTTASSTSSRTRFPSRGGMLDEAGAGPARLHRLPEGALAPDLVEQPAGAPEQGDPPPHRRRRHLPQPRRGHPPRRRRARRAARRVGRRPPLHERRVDRQGARRPADEARGGDGHRPGRLNVRRG